MYKTECIIELVQGRCRKRLTPNDYDFLTTILGSRHKNNSLETLFRDPEALDIMLDEPTLSDIITETSEEFSVSSRFYLYVLLRHTFIERNLHDRVLADYVAEVLATYFHSSEMQKAAVRVNPLGYIFDLTKKMQKSGPAEIFRLRMHVANFVLFQLGIFPERFCTRKSSHSPLDFEFLESMAIKHIRKAADDPRAETYDLIPVLHQLEDRFREIRLAINLMAENNLFIREQSLAYH